MNGFTSRKWSPIEDLPKDWEVALKNPHTAALVQAWHEQAGELRQKNLYREFLGRLQRQWAIETGVIEGLYSLSEGATTALIEKGLDASLISHEDTSDSPDNVIAKIRDQHQAIMGLYQFVSGNRPLGTSYIKELHQVLTAHQDTYVARDTLGNTVTRFLPKGEWKTVPNNVELPDGTRFEYCPHEHVAQEIDNLLAWHREHESKLVPPDIEAAWLHHRFSIIHPFTDGNGRVSRCLATLILLKANWLPLVVTRHDRTHYISALRAADRGDLKALVDFFCDLQRKAILEALSLGEDVIHDARKIDGILASVKERFGKRRADRNERIQEAYGTADTLLTIANLKLNSIAKEIQEAIGEEGENFGAQAVFAPRGSATAKYYYHQIVRCATALNYFADLPTYQAWAALRIQTDHRTEILFSFHGIGQGATGVIGCAPMLFTRDKAGAGESDVSESTPLADAPFEFTYVESAEEVRRRFARWQDECVLAGLEIWRKTV